MDRSGLGPRLLHQDQDFRIEQYIEGRPLSIWEMRNPTIMKVITKAIYDFHNTSGIADSVNKPFDRDNLAIDHFIDDWGT